MNESTKSAIPVDSRPFAHRLRSWGWWLLALAWMGGIYLLSAQSTLPLPVEGWGVSVCDGRFGIADRRSFAQPAQLFDTRRAAYVWAWTEAEAPTDGTGATDGLEARVSKVEGVLARICPEADGQVDGKGRTLREIDDAINDRIAEFHDLGGRIAAVSERVESLIAASVPVPAKVNVRSDAASTNEAMTEAAASDEGWREMLVRLVPKVKAWTRPQPCPCRLDTECRKCRTMRL